ncbi:MAG: hypothetical protein AAGD43_07645 [Pseudomonadota bacterium]
MLAAIEACLDAKELKGAPNKKVLDLVVWKLCLAFRAITQRAWYSTEDTPNGEKRLGPGLDLVLDVGDRFGLKLTNPENPDKKRMQEASRLVKKRKQAVDDRKTAVARLKQVELADLKPFDPYDLRF